MEVEDFESWFAQASVVSKHGTHDQKTHGSWATGSEGKVLTSLIDRLAEKKTPGFSIDIRTKKSPKTGYMCSIDGAERQIKLDKWNSVDNDGKRAIIEQYKKDNMGALSKRGAYFGAWKVAQDGVIYLDVSRRYESKSEGISAGIANRQKSIYDVVKDAYIYMEDENDGTRANKARAGGVGQTSERDDSRGVGRADGRNSDGNRGQSVSFPHVCLGRYSVVGIQKHLEGQHDQATHGNWAGDRYPADSVKSARDGAKEYAFKKGLNPDETIDYTKVVANRERASKIADIYESLPKMDRDAVDEYEALASEVEEQFNYMTKTLGVKVEFVTDDPYKTSKEMFDDVSKGTLKVLQTETTGAHPIFSNEQNNKFRAVHDYFGHAATGRGFGQDGEESAWVHHSQMFTQKATAALTTETRGQNSFFNNRGKQFADQKVALLPEEFWAVPKVFQKGYQVIYFAPGLKPVIKHQEHDQSTHGSWAHGISDEDEALINQMSSMGPSKEDILNALGSGERAGMEDLITMVNNDQGLYESATDGIDERVAERLADLQQEFPNHEYSEQEKMDIHDNVQNEMIDEYIQSDDGTIAQMWEEQNGGAFDPEELHSYFDEVYSLDHQVTNNDGEAVTILSSSTTNIYQDGERLVINGEVTDSSGNYAGEFQRSFYKETNDNGEEVLVVEHDIFRMADEYQGSGFGSKFLAQQEAYYVSKGIDAINVSTAWDGARHWARAGFDFNPKSIEGGVRSIVNRANEMAMLGRFAFGTSARQEFDSLMFRTVEQYGSDANGIAYRGVKSMTENNFPTPNDFAMIGYGQRVVSGLSEYGKPIYSWAGKELLNDLHLKYRKGLTQEGRTLNQGPIDRDGDGLVYDGTIREKPVSAVNSAP